MSTEDLIYKPSEWGQRFHSCVADEIFGAGAAGPGKALSLETDIPTPGGMRKLRDIKPNDLVFSQTGAAVRVLAESDHFVDRKCFSMTIRGEVFIADAEHEWVMAGTRGYSSRGVSENRTTQELFDEGKKRSIKQSLPSVYQFRQLPLQPYLLGMMMFQGLEQDRSVFHGYSHNTLVKLHSFGLKYDDAGYKMYRIMDPEVQGVINEYIKPVDRRIPEEYLTSSISQRRQLLQGILDSQENGECPTVHKDNPIVFDLMRLAGSLGYSSNPALVGRWKNKKYIKVSCAGAHGVEWDSTYYVNPQYSHRKIASIKECESVTTKCIQVQGGTFLIGLGHHVTHNSMVLLHDPIMQIQVEHLRAQQDDSAIPESFSDDIREAIIQNPITPGHSEAWVLQMMREMPNHDENIARSHRAFKAIDPEATWNEKKAIWQFSSGLRYQFGHCKDKNDHEKYLSKQYTYLGFDELTRFNKIQYDFLRSRVRSADPVLKHLLRCCAMSNPRLATSKTSDIVVDDPLWVKKYFVDPWPEGNKLLTRKLVRADGTQEKVTRIYLPATLYDNPDKVFVKQYELRLLSLPKHIRDCYLYGKWDGVIGSHFGDYWNPSIHVCEPFKIPPDWPVFRAMDWGFSTNGNVGYYALSPDNKLYKWFEITFIKKTADYVARELIKPFEIKNKLWDPNKGSKLNLINGGPSDRQIWEERGSSAKTKYMEFADAGVEWMKADQKSREDNCQTFKERLLSHNDMTEPPGIVFFKNCRNSIQTIPSLETDPHNLEQTKKAANDHWFDETTYACRFAMMQDLSPTSRRDEDLDEWETQNERYY